VHTHWRLLLNGRSLLALALGLMAFVGLSLFRIHLQFTLQPVAALGLVLTVLMYLLPGAIVALLVSERRLMHGAVLGLLTVCVVWCEVPLRSVPVSWLDLVKFVVFMVLFGVVVSTAGAGVGSWAIRRVTSNNRSRGP
jgi:hypothetical protein